MKKTLFFIILSITFIFFIESGLALAASCAGVLPGGDYDVAANCTFAYTVDGVDEGNLTIKSGYTLTINAGQTVAWNQNYTVTIEKPAANIAINVNGTLKKTNLWMVDADSDNYPAATTQYTDDNKPANARRRHDMTTITTADGDDEFLCTTNYEEVTGCTAACTGCSNGACVSTPNDAQDIWDANTCSADCQKCSGGSCIDQDGEDLFGDCAPKTCGAVQYLACKTGSNCTAYCATQTKNSGFCVSGACASNVACACASVGYDAGATNMLQYLTYLGSPWSCITMTATCANTSAICFYSMECPPGSGKMTNWINCKCI